MSRPLKAKLARNCGSPDCANPSDQASQPEIQPLSRWLTVTVCLFLALAVWAVFGQTLHHKFVNYDDNENVCANPNIVSGLTWRGIGWAFTHTQVGRWAPIATISRLLDCTVFGLWPGGHHLTNVLFHAASSILLFLVLRQMTGALWRSAFVAAVFAIHPLRVESVAWVSARGDVTSAFFFMLTLWAYTRYAQNKKSLNTPVLRGSTAEGGQHSATNYTLALVFFALGLLCKTMLVTLPFVLLLLDYWPLKRFTLHTSRNAQSIHHSTTPILGLLLEKVPFLLLSTAGCVTTIRAQRSAFANIQDIPFPWRVGNALVSYADYLGQMLYPVGLALFYPHLGNHLPVWKVGVSVMVLSIISVGVMAGRRKHPCLLVGWLWYLGMLLPVIGFIHYGKSAHADRYTYLPQIGLYILVVWGVVELGGSWRYRRAGLASAALAILAGLLAGAYVQTGYWKDSVSLWTHTLACTSENSLAHNYLGLALAAQGKLEEAVEHYERTLQIKPDYVNAHNNLGNVLARQGKLTEAIEHYERALQIKPDDANAHNNLGNALARQGKLTEAIEHYEWALQIKPDDATACNNLAVALIAQGKLDEAVQYFQQALNLAAAQGNTALAETIRTRLKSYPSALPQPQKP